MMSPEVKRLQDRMNSIVDRWLRATPTEKTELLLEKVRLEDALDSAKRRDRMAS